ncbi:MAG TPA: ATP-dependent helicase, partial [Actinomycetota bacterium]
MDFLPDDEQVRVLGHERGAMLVIGEPGTGKSAVLRERFARLIEGEADPERVVLVVRTRWAKAEARAHLFDRLRASLPGLKVLTVYGLAHHVLTRRFGALDYESPPGVLTAADQFSKVRDLLGAEDPSDWPAYGPMLGLRGFADEVRQFLLRAQEALIEPEEVERTAAESRLSGWDELAAFYRTYLDVLGSEEVVDFAGLVAQAGVAAARDGEPLFDHVLVDDYQDATFASERLVLALGGRAGSLVVAGHAGSHAFSFQGTTVQPLERFPESMAGVTTVRLATPHRSPGLDTEAWFAPHTSEEQAAAARELRRVHLEDRVPWQDLAVVVRREGTHVGGLLRALDDAGVPRSVPESGLSLLAERATFPFVLALRWIARPEQRDGLVESLLTSGLAQLSPAAARGLVRAAAAAQRPGAGALEHTEGLAPQEVAGLDQLRQALGKAEAKAASVLD